VTFKSFAKENENVDQPSKAIIFIQPEKEIDTSKIKATTVNVEQTEITEQSVSSTSTVNQTENGQTKISQTEIEINMYANETEKQTSTEVLGVTSVVSEIIQSTTKTEITETYEVLSKGLESETVTVQSQTISENINKVRKETKIITNPSETFNWIGLIGMTVVGVIIFFITVGGVVYLLILQRQESRKSVFQKLHEALRTWSSETIFSGQWFRQEVRGQEEDEEEEIEMMHVSE
jgi:hypothetical protein